jgi:predicted nucleic acid-binding protein
MSFLDRLFRRVRDLVDYCARREFRNGRPVYQDLRESVVVSDLASLEVCAVVSREFRAGRHTRASAEKAFADFEAFRAQSERLSHGPGEFALAEQLVRDFSTKLAAADALHLASAKNAKAALATFDARLAEAARAQGVEVAPG